MTRQIAESAEAILAAAETLAELELQFAKARFGEDYNASPLAFRGWVRVGEDRLLLHAHGIHCLSAT